jgi:hypothetical protein
MSLQDKYREVTNLAENLGIANLQVREQDNVLYIDGIANSAADKDKLWDAYNKIDPEYRSADVVMNIEVTEKVSREYTVEIGKAYGVSWQDIYEANKNIIKNPDLIEVGWKLKIPTV